MMLQLLPFDVRCLIYKEKHRNYTNAVIKDLFSILQWDDTKSCYIDNDRCCGCFQIRRYDTTDNKWVYIYDESDGDATNIFRIIKNSKVIYEELNIEIPQNY